MQKLCCVRTRQHPLPVWSHKFVLSSTTHISTNSHPFLVGIVSKIHYESLFEHESSSEEEMSYSYPGETVSESTHILQNTQVKKFFVKNKIYGMKEMMEKQFWGEN